MLFTFVGIANKKKRTIDGIATLARGLNGAKLLVFSFCFLLFDDTFANGPCNFPTSNTLERWHNAINNTDIAFNDHLTTTTTTRTAASTKEESE